MRYFNNRMLLMNSYWSSLKDKFNTVFSFSSSSISYKIYKIICHILFVIPFLSFTLISIILNILVYPLAFVFTIIFALLFKITNSSFDGLGAYFNLPLIISRFLLCFIIDALATLFYILCTFSDMICETETYEIINCFQLYSFFFNSIFYIDMYTRFKYDENYIKMQQLIKEFKKHIEMNETLEQPIKAKDLNDYSKNL